MAAGERSLSLPRGCHDTTELALDDPWNSGAQVGVSGCGKKAVYGYSSAR